MNILDRHENLRKTGIDIGLLMSGTALHVRCVIFEYMNAHQALYNFITYH